MKGAGRFSILLLCVLLIVAMIPAAAFGAEGDKDGSTVDRDSGYGGAMLPTGPEKDGDVWTVNPENAQYTLDGAYGSIDGKIINFGAGEYTDVLELARATKYEGSNTLYYNMEWTTETGWVADVDPSELIYVNSTITTYVRAVRDVTFTADEGAVLTGFSARSGHIYSSGNNENYDYVMDQKCVSTSLSYHQYSSLENISFDGLNIKGQVVFNNYAGDQKDAVIDGIKFTDCVFSGDEEKMAGSTYAAIRMSADSEYFSNINVTDCSFADYFQGIYIQGPDGVMIAGNTIDGTTHNAIAMQSSTGNPVKGDIVIAENIIKNGADRAVRFGRCDGNATIAVNNNVFIDSGDDDGEIIKMESLPADLAKVSLENNYWNGSAASVAVGNDEIVPTAVGLTGGIFTEDVSAYMAEGYDMVRNDDGTFTVAAHTHDYGDKWMYNEDGHWQVCACGEKSQIQSHTAGQWIVDKPATTEAEGSRHKECTVCGMTMQTQTIAKLATQGDGDSDGGKVPETSDMNNMAAWVGVLGFAAVAAAVLKKTYR